MDTALEMHNCCVRRMVAAWRGYECHTEGDSFVLAFHAAKDAVACALEVQVGWEVRERWGARVRTSEKRCGAGVGSCGAGNWAVWERGAEGSRCRCGAGAVGVLGARVDATQYGTQRICPSCSLNVPSTTVAHTRGPP